MIRIPTEKTERPYGLAPIILFIFSFLFTIQMASSGAILKRPLRLDDAKFEGRDLSGVDFRKASLKRANFINTNLNGANLRGADLTDAKFEEADLANADLTGTKFGDADIKNNACEQLTLALHLNKAYREETLGCGVSIPTRPKPSKEERGRRGTL